MSWHDMTSPWQKQLRWQTYAKFLIAWPILFFPLVFVDLSHLWKYGLVATLCLMLLLQLIKSNRRYKRIRQEVPKSEGSLCPWCLVQIADEPDRPACPKCRKRYDPVELQRYWIRYVLDPQNAVAIKTLAYVTPKGIRRMQRKLLLLRLKHFLFQYGIVGFQLFIFLSLVIYLTFGIKHQSLLHNSFQAFRSMGFFIAFALFQTTQSKRRGLTKCCVKCEYIHPPEGATSEQCPECGTKWLELGDYQIGITQKSYLQLYITIGILIAWSIVVATTVDIPAFLQMIFRL